MLVNKLALTVAAQEHTEGIEPGDNALQFDPVYEEDRQRHLVLADMVQESVLEVLFVGCHFFFLPPITGANRHALHDYDRTIVRCTQNVQSPEGKYWDFPGAVILTALHSIYETRRQTDHIGAISLANTPG